MRPLANNLTVFLRAGCSLLAIVFLGHQALGQTSSGPWEKYIWETCKVTNIQPPADPLIAELRAEIDKILQAGPLAPMRTVYADLEQDPYFLYWQGGRIVTTLAYAWPYLDRRAQERVIEYVRNELRDETRTPWTSTGFVPPNSGARRELHSFHESRGWDRYWAMWGKRKPNTGSLYGLWLYAERTQDWTTLEKLYPQLSDFYKRRARECDLYGTMGAHIAVARVARHFGDATMLQLGVSNAVHSFQQGTNFLAVEDLAKKYWPERYSERQKELVYQGWMFLDLCPEIGRFLDEHVREVTLGRHAEGLRLYPLFWLREAPYFTRWTGDEGLGIPTEMMGMIVPVERWVKHAAPDQLALYVRSAPICIGDLYWIEALIHAIEARGSTLWQPVRM